MSSLLTTTEAAELASVAPSTIKRWSDHGLLPFARTAGGHRRFQRAAIERLLREQIVPVATDDPLMASWIRCLVGGLRHEIDGRLLEARSRLGAWHRVADELGSILDAIGTQWACGRLTIADEHAASECLIRALARLGEALPVRVDGQRCLLACAGEDDHTLGLAMAELCLRESGWNPRWLGRRTPVSEIIRLLDGGQVAMVALSASVASSDEQELNETAAEIGTVCAERGVDLVLGGSGAWPAHPAHGIRLSSISAFHEYLAQEGQRS